jgi:hypothetical protein
MAELEAVLKLDKGPNVSVVTDFLRNRDAMTFFVDEEGG